MAYRGDRDTSADPFDDASEPDGIELIDLTGVDEVKIEHAPRAFPAVNKSQRNYSLAGDHRSAKQVSVHGSTYQVGHFVELRQLVGMYNIQFVEIKSINVHNETDNVVIRGLPYARTRDLGGCLHKMKSEVCLILEVEADDTRPDEQQALLQIEPEQILKRRILTNTNRPFPKCRFDDVVFATNEQREQEAPLACRWKMRAEYKNASQRRAGRLQGQSFEHLSERDNNIKKRNLGVDKERSRAWRGETDPDPIKGEDGSPRIREYSFAEISGGAGGASRGAQMAGFNVILATEPCLHACNSYRANFPDTELYHLDVRELAAGKDQFTVDVLHISSSALAALGDDEQAAEKMCTAVLKTFLPRVVMMDQPSTITSEKNTPFFNRIILSFTKSGYSIQWRHVNMVEYGLPQLRKRLLMIGTGPGEQPVSWPSATHSSAPTGDGDQKPFITEEEAIGSLNSKLHSLHNPESLPVIRRAARDADKPIDVIGNNGSAYPHPDGEREFTLRELASLQGFPTYHEFKGCYVKKQIGTAFPPVVGMAFYQHIRQHMEEVDALHSSPSDSFEMSASFRTSNLLESDSTSQSREVPRTNGTPENAVSDRNGNLLRSASRQRIEPAALSFSPPSTFSSQTQQVVGPESPMPLPTPPPTQQLPTPPSSGRFIAGQRAAALRRRRERAVFEEDLESDGDNDEGGPETLQTPSKRRRTSTGSDTSRTVSVSSDVERDNDASMSDEDGGQAGGDLDGEGSEMWWDVQSHRSEDHYGEI